MDYRKLFLVFMSGLLLCSASAQSDFSVGASVGSAKIEIDDDGIGFDSNDIGWKIYGLYMFNETWGIEGGYVDFGKPDEDITVPGVGTANFEIDANGLDLFGVGTFPASENIDIFAKVGVVFWDADISAGVGGVGEDDSDDGTDLALGVGGKWNTSQQLSIRAEWEWFDIEDSETVWLLSIGGEYRF